MTKTIRLSRKTQNKSLANGEKLKFWMGKDIIKMTFSPNQNINLMYFGLFWAEGQEMGGKIKSWTK